MSTFLKPLTDIKAPDLIEFDRDSLVAEIVERIQADPNWNSIWDGELVHNFAYFIINTFSYLFSKNAETANRIIREAFITQAKDPLSVINYLSNFSLNLKQNTASMAEVTVRPNDGGSFTLPFTLTPGFSLTATTINNNQITYEIYNLELDQYGNETDKIDYGSSIEIPTSNFYKVKAFSGVTVIKTLELDPITQTEKFIYNITDTDIIENSIRIYYQYGVQNAQEELIETDSFVINPKITNTFTESMGGVPHYKIKYNTDGSAKVIFGSREFGGSFPSYGGTLTIFYRTGGGITSNIQRGGINNVIDLVVDNYNTIPVSFYNFLAGGGGGNRETLDEAQFYAPYRIGRSRSIIDEIDALNELRNSVVKHLVKSPKYNGINVPILHYHNYIVPPRNFNNFKFPIPNSTDTYLTYKTVFELELNKFLNLDGIHDGSENDVLISFFRNTNFNFPLPYKPPLNGSLYISAYNNSGKEIDRLIWGSNYSGTSILPNIATSSANVQSTNVLTNLSITQGYNFLYFNIDDQIGDYTISETGLTYFKIEITPISYQPSGLAQEINNKIKSIDNYYSNFGTSAQFAYINSDGKLVISSLTTGLNSKVKLYDFASDSILEFIGLSEIYVDASPQNREVFKEDSIYDFQNHKISVSLNTDNEKTKYYYNQISNWSDPDDATGPIIYLSFKDENNNLIYVQEGEDLIINCKNASNSIADSLIFSNISNLSDNAGVISNSGNGNVFDDSNSTLCKYNYANGEIVIKLTDSNGASGSYSFPVAEDGVTELYNTSFYFEIIYQNKTYSFITVSMIPNPYLSESEALQYALKLKSKDKKMIGVEPLLKKVIFKPVLLDITINPLKGYSREQAIRDTTNLIYGNFTYNLMINDISIGTGLSIQTIESFLNNKQILQSVEKAKVTLPVSDLLDPNENTYYFIFDVDFLGRIKKFEETYTQLVGLYDSYRLKVKIA